MAEHLQVAIFANGNLTTLQTQVNAFLATIDPRQIASVRIHSRVLPTAVTVVMILYRP